MSCVNNMMWLTCLILLASGVSAQNNFFVGTGTNRDRNFDPNNGFSNNNNNVFVNNNQQNPFNTRDQPFNSSLQFIGPQQRNRDNDFDLFNVNTGANRRQQFNFNSNRDFSTGQQFGDNSAYSFPNPEERKCPSDWELFQQFCYRFVRSPIHNRQGARMNCQAYGNGSSLLNINSVSEHSWIVKRLSALDPQKRLWYVSARQDGGAWVNADGSQLNLEDQAFLPDQPSVSRNYENRYLAYSYSDRRNRWGLLKVPGSDMYLYICEIPLSQVPLPSDERDFEYGLDVLDTKKIPRGPFFIRQPEPAVFDLSRNIPRSSISLTCLAGGWPSPQYKWFKEEYANGTLISKLIDPLREPKYTVSGGSLMVDNPKQKDDGGNYHCVASNKFGSATSETVAISFGFISEFILARSDDQGKQYWGKSIHCDAPQHFPGVYYLWARKYFPNLIEEDQRVFVSYDGNLYISAVDMSDQGNYSCNVQSKVSPTGKNGPFFNLQVTPNANYQQLKFADYFPKVFPEAPQANDEVRLECVAFGYPVPSYNWTRKGGTLPRGTILQNFNRVLTIPNAQVEDQGEYTCRATNSRLSIEHSLTLSIQASPVFTIELGNRHMDQHSDLTWICEAFGIPDVSYQWYRNAAPLIITELPADDIGRYLIQDNVLTIRELENRDQGMYQCRANNSLAAKFSSGQLRVLAMPPSFKKHPVEGEILAAIGGNVTIRCKPEAAPRPRFQWRKDGNIIGSSSLRQILPDGSLFIRSVSWDDQGYFTCAAQNKLGRAESTGRLSVLQGPDLINPFPSYHNLSVGDTLKLFCRAAADSTLDVAYIWRHNGIRLDKSLRTKMDSTTGYSILTIHNMTLADKGEYECEVNTWVGIIRRTTAVEISGPPGSPGGVQASNINSRSARVMWTDGAMNGDPAEFYSIQGRTQWDPVWRTLVENETARDVDREGRLLRVETGRKVIELKNVLSPWSAYEFRVLAANDYGYGPPSAASPQSNTPPDKPFEVPRNIGGGGGKTGSLTITWEPLPPKDQNAPGIYYKVFWRLHKPGIEDEYQSEILSRWGNIGMHVVTFPSTDYYYTLFDVKVQAWNSEGAGPESAPVQVYSAEDMPQVMPSDVVPIVFNSTAINVTWSAVEETREKMRGKLIGYRIRYWPKKGDALYDPQALNYLSRSTRPWALILGLQPYTYYYVQVMAYNQAGPGPASEAQFERTNKKAPQKPPTSVNVIAIDPSTIKVTWRYVSPSQDEEALTGYKVRVWEADQDISTANDTIVPIGVKSEAIVRGLQPEKPYFLRILGYSSGGDGKMSSPAKEFILALKSTGNVSRFSPMLVLAWTCLSVLNSFKSYVL